jgi:lactoylglutathione lyase
MKLGYVVLYVDDVEACLRFWIEKVGMIEKDRNQAGDFSVVKVGFADQEFNFELVPLSLMAENPDGLDLASPSIAFRVENLDSTRSSLVARGVQVSEVTEHSGVSSFGFADNENRWFAVAQV